MATSVTSTNFSQELLQSFHPRKFLLHSSLHPPEISSAQEHSYSINDTFHTNAAIVVLALFCTIISSYGLLFIVKCINRSSASVAADPKLANAGGVKQKALNSIPIVKYATESKLPGLDTACVICLSEFAAGESLRILSNCNHGFHTCCIDTWLGSHSSCPTCRHCLTETNKINMGSMQPVEQ